MGEVAAPVGRCTPILLVPHLLQEVQGGTILVYGVVLGKRHLLASILENSVEHVSGYMLYGKT